MNCIQLYLMGVYCRNFFLNARYATGNNSLLQIVHLDSSSVTFEENVNI